jgi:hypothetical protein
MSYLLKTLAVPPADEGTSYSYQEYEGSPLKMETLQEGLKPNERFEFLLSQHAAVMP